MDRSNMRTGHLEHSFRWKTTGAHSNGYIVQHMQHEDRVPSDADADAVDYWEAWRVQNGEVAHPVAGSQFSPGQAHDTWLRSTESMDRPPSSGRRRLNAEVYFCRGGLPDHFQPGRVLEAGALHASRQPPPAETLEHLPHLSESRSMRWSTTGTDTDTVDEMAEEALVRHHLAKLDDIEDPVEEVFERLTGRRPTADDQTRIAAARASGEWQKDERCYLKEHENEPSTRSSP